jgi:ribosome-binding ATPase YchF (GTP1/OBG family)
MSIAGEFINDSKDYNLNEEVLDYVIDNYKQLLYQYRIIKLQIDQIQERQEDAHKKLTEIRNKEQEIRKNKIVLTEKQMIELEEKKEFYQREREEGGQIYFNGKKIEYTEGVAIIVKYETAFKYLEKTDTSFKKLITPCVKNLSKFILSPVKSLFQCMAKEASSEIMKNRIEEIVDTINNIPEGLCLFINDPDIDLSPHMPPKRSPDEDTEE